MATTKQLINQALRTIGVLASGEEAKPSEVQDAIVYAQQMLGSWANDNLMLHFMIEESLTLSDQRNYTIGYGGDFDTSRPTIIKHARIRYSAGLEVPVKISSHNVWAEIGIKDSQESTPNYLYYRPEYPLGKIQFSSVPIAGDELILTSEKPLADLPSLTSQVTFPPGYDKVIRLGLAIELAPEYGKSISQEHAALYASAMKSLKRTNSIARMGVAKVDSALVRRRAYDINHGPV